MSCVIQTRLTCIEASTDYPMDAEYARRHLKSVSHAEDELVQAWITAAAQYFEEQSGRILMQSTWEYWLDSFPSEAWIELPLPPLVSVESVQYMDGGTLVNYSDGASPETLAWQALTPAGIYARRGIVQPIAATAWPTVGRIEPGAVRIRFTAGYASVASEVPDVIKAALLMLVGSFDQFRSEMHYSEGARVEAVPFGAEQIIDGFKKTAYATQVLHRP